MFKFILATAIAVLAVQFPACSQVKEVIITEGGNFGAPGNKVKFCAFQPLTKKYYAFDSIAGDFAQASCIVNHTGFLYAGNSVDSLSFLCKYDLLNKTKLSAKSMPGLQQMTTYKSKLLTSKGYPRLSNFFAIYQQSNLNLIKEFPEINLSSQGMHVYKDKAYIAMEGSWPTYTDSGSIAVVNLTNDSFERIIKLDTLNKVVRHVQGYKDVLYCFGDSLITSYDLVTNQFTHFGLAQKIKVVDFQGRYVVLKMSNGDVKKYAFDSLMMTPTLLYNGPFEVGTYDYFGDNFYCNSTDFFSYGRMVYANSSTGKIDSINIGIAATSIALYNKHSEVSNDSFGLNANTSAIFDLTTNDALMVGKTVQYGLASSPKIIGSTASINNGKITYTASKLFVGNDTLTIEMCDYTDDFCLRSTLVVTILNPTSAIENLSPSVDIYPNPTTDLIHIQGVDRAEINLYNLQGKLIYQNQLSGSIQIDCTAFERGTYLLMLKNDNRNSQHKIVIQ